MIILVGLVGITIGFILQGNISKNVNNTTVINQTNTSVTNNSINNSSKIENKSDVPYRINSNTPNCPNCGSNNIEQLADSYYDNETDTWYVLSKCRYCGYEWTYTCHSKR